MGSCKKLPLAPSDESARCSGHCCRSFVLPHSPNELREGFAHWESIGRPPGHDIEIITPMVVHLGLFDVSPTTGLKLVEPSHFYTCRHFEAATGDCGIYASRPRMCREYPYGDNCENPDCTMRGGVGVVVASEPDPDSAVAVRPLVARGVSRRRAPAG